MTKVKPIPTDFHTLTPHLTLKDSKKLSSFIKNVWCESKGTATYA